MLKVDDVVHNPEKKDSAKIKQKYLLSDGVCSVKAIVSESVLNRQSSKPKKFDVVRVTGLKKIELGKSTGKDLQWLINLTAPIEILFTYLTSQLGSP